MHYCLLRAEVLVVGCAQPIYLETLRSGRQLSQNYL